MTRKTFYLIMILLVGVFSLCGDTYIKINYHCDSYYNYGNLVPEEDNSSEYWFGDKRMVFLTSRLKLMLDLRQKKLWIANLPNKIFFETPIPPDFEKTIAEKVLTMFSTDEAGGSIKATGETKTISKRLCRGYEKKFRMADQGSQYEDRVESLWMTVDVPFALELYHSLNSLLVELYRYVAHWDESLVTDLQSLKGFPMAVYSRLFIKGTMRIARQEVIEMAEKIPSVEVYSIPPGFKQEEQLTLPFFNTFPYHGAWGILDQ